MEKNRKISKYLICAIAIATGGTLYAQDFHLTQYDAAPQYLNPALTGLFMGTDAGFRVNSNYRSQWRALPIKPYTTLSLGYDQPYKRFGVGGFIINNRSGIGHFNTFEAMASGSYRIIDDPAYKHNLSVGLQMGLMYKSFDPSQYLYDEQYSVSYGGLNPDLPNGENIEKNTMFRFDANMGVFYKYRDENRWYHPFMGLSLYHVTRPNDSFTSFIRRLPIHYIGNLGADMIVNEKIRLRPDFLFMYQAKAREITFGLLGFYHIEDTEYDAMLGAHYRNKDAVMIHAGIQRENNIFRVSYDINTSYLNNFSRGRGAIEFSLIYMGKKKEKYRTKESFL